MKTFEDEVLKIPVVAKIVSGLFTALLVVLITYMTSAKEEIDANATSLKETVKELADLQRNAYEEQIENRAETRKDISRLIETMGAFQQVQSDDHDKLIRLEAKVE